MFALKTVRKMNWRKMRKLKSATETNDVVRTKKKRDKIAFEKFAKKILDLELNEWAFTVEASLIRRAIFVSLSLLRTKKLV